MSRIIIEDGFLSYQQCVQLREITDGYPYQRHGDTFTYNIVGLWREYKSIVDRILVKSREYANEMFPSNHILKVQRGDVVWWPVGSSMAPHYDIREAKSLLTSIVYLNDCDTGKTVFDNNLEVQPKAGRAVFYDGKHFEHSVTEVKGSDRYTLALWYEAHRPTQEYRDRQR